jgi:hypothetical protein
VNQVAVKPKDPLRSVAAVKPGQFNDATSFLFENAAFTYEPFPIGLITPIIDDATYKTLVDTYPDISLFKMMPYLGNKKSVKYSLAEMNNPREYADFLAQTPGWRDFYNWVKSPEFLVRTLVFLSKHNIELGYIKPDAKKPLIERLKDAWLIKTRGHSLPLRARFEFSVLPADGGQLHPHTDSPSKIITYVVSMLHDGQWNQDFGGGTDMMRPKRTDLNYNWVNRYLEFDEVDILHTYPFLSNQALIFVKTFNSWHGVKPMTGHGSKDLRRTLTINIERTDLD